MTSTEMGKKGRFSMDLIESGGWKRYVINIEDRVWIQSER